MKPILVRIPPRMHEMLARLAELHDVSQAEIVRRALTRHLREHLPPGQEKSSHAE